MYTVKIRWQRTEKVPPTGNMIGSIQALIDEHVLYIPADRVETHGILGESPNMEAWEADQYESYVSIDDEGNDVFAVRPSRLISVWRDGSQSYYLVSEAWLLGPNGDTIQRLAP